MLNRVAWSSRSRRGGQLHGERHKDYRKHSGLRKEYSPFYRGEGPGYLLLTVKRPRNMSTKSNINITIETTKATHLLLNFPTTLICLPRRLDFPASPQVTMLDRGNGSYIRRRQQATLQGMKAAIKFWSRTRES